MIESKIYKELNKLLKNNNGLLQRIESGSTSAGIADCYFIYNNMAGWIEIKQTNQNKKGIIKIPYRPGQQAWLMKNKCHGGKSFVLLHLNDFEYYLINKNFNIKEFKNKDELTFSCCWRNEKLEKTLLTSLLLF